MFCCGRKFQTLRHASCSQCTVPEQYDDKVRRGALVNLLGLIGKLLYPLLFLAITWLGEPEMAGLYLLCIAMAEMGASAVQAGFTDAVVIYASHHVENAEHDHDARRQLYRVLASGFVVPVLLGLCVALALQFAAGPFVALVYPGRPELVPALKLIGWTLPLIGVSQAGIAATKARMHMEHDALLNGFVRPALLLVLSILFWQLSPTLASLLWALLAAYAALALLSLRAFARHYSVRDLWQALKRCEIDHAVLRFGIPQSLHLTFDKYLTRLDLMMLGAMGYSNFDLGLYGSAAMITVNIREVRLIFSSALGPVIARYHAQGDRGAFAELLGRVMRWTTTIAAPIVLLVGATRTDLLGVFDASYAQADSRFMLLLLIPPMLNCSFGLVGNCIVFTGHSGYNLLNSVTVAALNTAFNYLLIPAYGLLGAAAATALASLLVTLLQMIELRALEHVSVRLRDIYKPHLGFILCAIALMSTWEPFGRGPVREIWLALALPLGFLGLMVALRHEEAMLAARRLFGVSAIRPL